VHQDHKGLNPNVNQSIIHSRTHSKNTQNNAHEVKNMKHFGEGSYLFYLLI